MLNKTLEVFAWRGPATGQRFTMGEEDAREAAREDGWARIIEEGASLTTGDPGAWSDHWKIPNYERPSSTELKGERTAELGELEHGATISAGKKGGKGGK
jgi:hypothetical protein